MKKEEFELNKKLLNDFKYSIGFPIISLLICLTFFISLNLIFKNMKTTLIILIIVYFILIIYWLFQNLHVPYNRTSKFGVAFYVDKKVKDNSNMNYVIDIFYDKLRLCLKDKFYISVVNKGFFPLFNIQKKIFKMMKKHNYRIFINEMVYEATEDEQLIYSLHNDQYSFLIPSTETEVIDDSSARFISCYLRKFFRFRNSNSEKDLDANSQIFSDSIKLTAAAIHVLVEEFDIAEEYLKGLKDDNDTRLVKYNINSKKAHKLIKEYDYILDKNKLSQLDEFVSEMEKLVNISEIDITSQYLFYTNKATILYVKNDISKAIYFIEKASKILPDQIAHKLSYAFLLTMRGNIPAGLRAYSDVLKIKNSDTQIIKGCLTFIEKCYEKEKNEKYKLCSGILNCLGLKNLRLGLSEIKEFQKNNKNKYVEKYIEKLLIKNKIID